MVRIILVLLAFSILATIFTAFYRTATVDTHPRQTTFKEAIAPDPEPDGYYALTMPIPTLIWQGVIFNSADNSGIDHFKHFWEVDLFSFATQVTSSIENKEHQVLTIDYNVSGNPFFVRPFYAEVVALKPDHFLGKLYLRLIPGFPIFVDFFDLNKSTLEKKKLIDT